MGTWKRSEGCVPIDTLCDLRRTKRKQTRHNARRHIHWLISGAEELTIRTAICSSALTRLRSSVGLQTLGAPASTSLPTRPGLCSSVSRKRVSAPKGGMPKRGQSLLPMHCASVRGAAFPQSFDSPGPGRGDSARRTVQSRLRRTAVDKGGYWRVESLSCRGKPSRPMSAQKLRREGQDRRRAPV